jgi:hypothetical protein
MRNNFKILCLLLISNVILCNALSETDASATDGTKNQEITEVKSQNKEKSEIKFNTSTETKNQDEPKFDEDVETYKKGGSGGIKYRPRPPVIIGGGGGGNRGSGSSNSLIAFSFFNLLLFIELIRHLT